MFIYQPEFDLSLDSYGIEIPILDSKFKKIYNYLSNHTNYTITNNVPHYESSEYIKLAHVNDYEQLLQRNPKRAIEVAYELINKDGSLNRYNPNNARRPLSNIVQVAMKQTSGSIFGSQLAMEHGFAYCLSGGHHHAMSFGGRGFCVINDIVVAARYQQKYRNDCQNIWIIDIDAHKGDGTAEITQADHTIVTLSIHMANGWPLDGQEFDQHGKRNPWFIASDIDIPISAEKNHLYLSMLESGLTRLARNYPKADLAIIVQGSDPHEKDELPSAAELSLSTEVMLERDLMVYTFLKELNIPQLYLMSGGYGKHSHEIYINFFEAIKHEF